MCSVAALALQAKAPTILRDAALKFYSITERDESHYKMAKMFGSKEYTNIEKAIAANVSASEEMSSNGFSNGYNPEFPDETYAGVVDYNSFYPVVIAASHVNENIDGKMALKAMILLDEIRCSFDEVYALHEHNIDNALFG
jgi:hypothetical protein